MLRDITYYLIFGKPLIMYLGILTLLSFMTTAYIGTRILKGKATVEQHKKMVITSFLLAGVHATLGILAYF
ncbi:MAG: hypothetical protein Q7T16_00380 [Candidatus Burarchaeum sp.]|nr:hypothetical protein [Candidatus Burarchaeum sp.]MDO8339095.1 hypothetical protein [Candidatus Burarchaeum sp.]